MANPYSHSLAKAKKKVAKKKEKTYTKEELLVACRKDIENFCEDSVDDIDSMVIDTYRSFFSLLGINIVIEDIPPVKKTPIIVKEV